MAYDSSTRDIPLGDDAIAQLFTEARTRNAFTDRPVSEDLLRRLYDLTKFGPTAANTTPARFLFITSPEAKARLAPLMAEGNREKTLKAPVNVILAHDIEFHEHMPLLFPHNPDAKNWFSDRDGRKASAGLNGSLQAGYFMIAARALGLDVHMLDRAELSRIAPYLGEAVLGAEFCLDEGKLSPLKANEAVRKGLDAQRTQCEGPKLGSRLITMTGSYRSLHVKVLWLDTEQ
jgi:3-hydroxypropanoate dehydrogenase